jgi:hypothetical protein
VLRTEFLDAANFSGTLLLLLSAQHFPEHFRQMFRFPSRDVFDLLAAGDSIRHHLMLELVVPLIIFKKLNRKRDALPA